MKMVPDFLAFSIVVIVVTLSSVPVLKSGSQLNFDVDFFQYASRHEAIRKSLIEYHTFPMRSHWLGGGFPTLGDPEDPTLNPLVLITILFNPITGLKLIVFFALLIGGLATYALARYILGYTQWGSLFSALIFSLSLFVPLRVQDGNPNEVYATFLPLCLLLIGLACRGYKLPILVLPVVFYTMLSDGKLNCFMGMFYIGVICLLNLIPGFRIFAKNKSVDRIYVQPLKVFLLVIGITFLVGMVRILPAVEHINAKGGLGNIDLLFYDETYSFSGYEFERLWQETVGWKGRQGLVTIGWLPVLLFVITIFVFWRKSLPWGIVLILFGWLALANNISIDLFEILWHLPIFNAVRQPIKYFSFQIVFTIAIASGQCFVLLKRLHPQWLEHLISVILIMLGIGFLYPRITKIQSETYNFVHPQLTQPKTGFFNVKGWDLKRNRKEPSLAITYFNLLRNIGTIDWYTGIPLEENAVPKYFVDIDNNYLPNPEYRGEAFLLKSGNNVRSKFRPNLISVEVNLQKPDILIINQNYHPDWHTDHGELFNKNGLIALRLDQTDAYQIHLRYYSRSFYLGLAITVVSMVTLGWVCWAYRTARLHDWIRHRSLLLRYSSRTILWLIER
ncbi:TPA: hypothetical protein EYN09_16360 [Candidatus Poribacteria bacterium]|nr:hypothetical protein [Candidatus Poribacteria bacterium]HIO08485.1 hypothetical protein [Candidatus Poribacteria bacterium]